MIDFGTLKCFKPLRFTNANWTRSDGFKRHGIFEIIGKHRNKQGTWICTIRRIASARPDCAINEQWNFSEPYLESETFYDDKALAVFT